MHSPSIADSTRSPGVRKILLLWTVVLTVIGLFLRVLLDTSFLFYWEEQYERIANVCFLLLLPFIAKFCTKPEVQERYLGGHATWSLRWFLVFPTSVALLTLILVQAPRGWIACSVWLFGKNRIEVAATVMEVRPVMWSKRCDRYATLRLDVDAHVGRLLCVEDRPAGKQLQKGHAVVLAGREGNLGFAVRTFRVAK